MLRPRLHRPTCSDPTGLIPPSGTWFALGPYDDRNWAGQRRRAVPLRTAWGVEMTAAVRSAKWMKLVADTTEMLTSAILGVPLFTALRVDDMREVRDAVGTETLETALAFGNEIGPMSGQDGVDELPPEP